VNSKLTNPKYSQEWDLNTGKIVREYTNHGAHISAIQLRPIWRNSTIAAPEIAQDADGPSITMNIAPKKGDVADTDIKMDETAAVKDATDDSMVIENTDGPVATPLSEEGDMNSLFGDDDEAETDEKKMVTQIEVDATASTAVPNIKIDKPVDTVDIPSAPAPEVSPTKTKGRRRASTLKKADDLYSDDEAASPSHAGPVPRFATAAQPKIARAGLPTLSPAQYKDYSDDVILVASMDGQVALHDRRVGSSRVGRLETTEKTPPWCMSVSFDGDRGGRLPRN
jgi:transcriptional activator SPT8